MVTQLEEYILANWDKMFYDRPRPDRLSFFINNNKWIRSLIWVFDGKKPCAFAKWSQDAGQTRILEQEFCNIKYVREIITTEHLKNCIPLPLGCIKIDINTVLILRFVSGRKMSVEINKTNIFGRNELKKDIDRCVEWLCRFQQETKLDEVELTKEYIQKEYFFIIEQYSKKVVVTPWLEHFLLNVRENLLGLVNEKIPICCSHGDFFSENIHVYSDGSISVLDWADMQKNDLAFWDLFMFFCSFRLANDNQTTEDNILKSFDFIFFKENWVSKLVNGFFDKYARIMRIEPKMLKAFLPLFLIKNAAQQVDEEILGIRKKHYWNKLLNYYVEKGDTPFCEKRTKILSEGSDEKNN
ncbi:MAG: hypothetical protein ABH952_01710 [Candidatus Omnitrophota bacterium]